MDTGKMFKEPERRQAAIANMTKSVSEIFGPAPGYDNGEHQPERNVTPGQEALPEPEEAVEEPEQPQLEGVGDNDIPGFTDTPTEPTPTDILRSWFEMRIAEVAAPETKQWIKDFLDGKIADKNSQDVETLKEYKGKLEKHLAGAGGGK